MSSASALQARVAALAAGTQPTPPASDPVVVTSTLNSALAGKVSVAALGLSRADIAAATIPLNAFSVSGYAAAGDAGAGAIYVRGTSSGLMAVQDKAGTWFNLVVKGIGRINVRWFGAVGDGVTNDSPAIQAAITAAYAVGGGEVLIPNSSAPYVLAQGLVMSHGVSLVGSGTTSWYGPTTQPSTWTDRGCWLKPTDTVNPAITVGVPGCRLRGLSFVYSQPTPVTGQAYAPTVYPWAIRVTQFFENIEDIKVVGASHGIQIDYQQAGNLTQGGGTYCTLRNIALSVFQRGMHFRNVNDTVRRYGCQIENVFYPLSNEVRQYIAANCIGDTFEYCDKFQDFGTEYLELAVGQYFKNSTVTGGNYTITAAMNYGDFVSTSFNNCVQAVKLDSATTVVSASYVNPYYQYEIIDSLGAQYAFDWNSDAVDVQMTAVRAICKRSLMRVGGANGGARVQICGLIGGGGTLGGYGNDSANSGDVGATCATGSVLSFGTGAADFRPGSYAGVIASGAGTIQGVWLDYTPTVSPFSNTLTAYTAAGRYRRDGRLISFHATVSVTTNGTASVGLYVTLPVLAPNSAPSILDEQTAYGLSVTTGKGLAARLIARSGVTRAGTVLVQNYDGSYPASDGAKLQVSGTYEVA